MACIFCQIVAGEQPASPVYEDAGFSAFMDIHPWRPGHVLVIPKKHCVRARDLTAPERAALLEIGVRIGEAARQSDLPCDDVHFMINDGPAANQSVRHVHLHVLPRKRGDLLRLIGQLARRPLVPILPPTRRARLDDQAAQLRAQLR
jgi:diadenosine tetraphosphate (Ap4A) HIT family hydrolase